VCQTPASIVAQLATWNGGAQGVQHGSQIDHLLEDRAADRWQPPPKAMNIATMLNAMPSPIDEPIGHAR